MIGTYIGSETSASPAAVVVAPGPETPTLLFIEGYMLALWIRPLCLHSSIRLLLLDIGVPWVARGTSARQACKETVLSSPRDFKLRGGQTLVRPEVRHN